MCHSMLSVVCFIQRVCVVCFIRMIISLCLLLYRILGWYECRWVEVVLCVVIGDSGVSGECIVWLWGWVVFFQIIKTYFKLQVVLSSVKRKRIQGNIVVNTSSTLPRPRLHLHHQRCQRQPPRSPSRGRQGPHGPRRTHLPPYPHRRTSARRHAWRT